MQGLFVCSLRQGGGGHRDSVVVRFFLSVICAIAKHVFLKEETTSLFTGAKGRSFFLLKLFHFEYYFRLCFSFI